MSYQPGQEAAKILKPETMARFLRDRSETLRAVPYRRPLEILDRWAVSEPERLLALEAGDTVAMQRLGAVIREIPTDYEIEARVARQAREEIDALSQPEALKMAKQGLAEMEILPLMGVEMGLAPASVINAEDWAAED